MNTKQENVDIVIIGGGIAGLWTFNRLKQLGYQVILLENQSIGNGQTSKSQGIIHGGIKYALKGALTPEANAISQMPTRWQDCLDGKGEIDLSAVKVLSPYHYLWTSGQIRAKINQFLANQVLSSHSETIKAVDYPSVFQHKAFKGRVYRVKENILDIPSLLHTLSMPHRENIIKIDDISVHYHPQQHIENVVVSLKNMEPVTIKAQCYLFMAGESNEKLIKILPNAPVMQRRPLHMVLAKLPSHHALYAHCIGIQPQPRLTVTTHSSADGQCIWYLGGQLAEEGIHRTPEQQCNYAKKELSSLLPWMDFSTVKWVSFYVNRAELQQPNQCKPDSSTLNTINNALIAWPTKLAFAPQLCQDIIQQLDKTGIKPQDHTIHHLTAWPKAPIAKPIWDQLLP